MSAPEIRMVLADAATIDEPVTEVPVSFWQRSFVQNVVPLCTSLALHAGLVIGGIAAYQVVKVIRTPLQTQIVVPVMATMDDGADNKALFGSGDRRIEQNQFPDVPELDGLSSTQGKDLSSTLSGGTAGEGQGSADIALGLTPSHPGGGRGVTGYGTSDGPGGEGGRLAPFGNPGGTGFQRGDFLGHRLATKVVFVLDATGSMMPYFDALRVQLRATIQGMRPPQSFNIVFINEHNVPPLAPSLAFVTPENKRKAFEYVDAMAPRGSTDPVPALEKAFAMQPELVILLVDPGDFPDKKAVLDLVTAKAGGGKIRMNVIGFANNEPENVAYLKLMAERAGGRYSYVSKEDLTR